MFKGLLSIASLCAALWAQNAVAEERQLFDLGTDQDKLKPFIPDMDTDAAKLAINVVWVSPCFTMGTVVTDGNGAAYIVTTADSLESDDGIDCRSGPIAIANMAFSPHKHLNVRPKPYKLILDEKSVRFRGANIAIFRVKSEKEDKENEITQNSIINDTILGVKRGGIEPISRQSLFIRDLMANNKTITASMHSDIPISNPIGKFWFEEDGLMGEAGDVLLRNKFLVTEDSGGSPIAVKDSSGTLRLSCIVVGRTRLDLNSNSDNFCVPSSIIAEYLNLPESNFEFDNLMPPKTIPPPTPAELAEKAAAAKKTEEAMIAIESGDYEAAYELLLDPANKGNVEAQAALGSLYFFGLGVSKNEAEATIWSLRAAEHGNADAQNILGVQAQFEFGTDKDAEAVFWFRKAAEQGSKDGQSNLASMYARGAGVAQDEAEAIYWYRKAAENGDAGAQLIIGMTYNQGQGVPKDTQEAVRWVLKAAEQGNAQAQFRLGVFYDNGDGVPEDDEKAVSWFRKSAEQGFASAQNNLAWMYGDGEGVQQDDVEAYFWIILALESSDGGHSDYPLVLSERMTSEQMRRALNKLDELDHEWTSDIVQALLDRERSALPK